jgi:SulP family sulfate permease
MFRPKLVECLQRYSLKLFQKDLIAGITVGVVALPLAMAFAIASGLTPEAGLFTAIVAGFLISALGGSKVQIGGPTGAFVIIVLGIYSQYGFAHLAVCTMLAGVILFVMGATKMGGMIKFIPYPVTMGFTSGIAVLIFSTQVRDFFGLAVEEMPAEFFGKIGVFVENIASVDLWTLGLSLISVALITFWPRRIGEKLPGSIVVLILGTLVVALFDIPVATIGSRFGGIPQGLPAFSLPDFAQVDFEHILIPSLTIAILSAIESLLSAVVADGLTEDRHDSNQELMAQGVANLASPLFGGIPATGAIARTATNIRNGGQTPVAGIVHALTLLLILLVAAPVAKYIPLASLSAILVVVALRMGEWHHFRRLLKWPKADAAVFLCVFALTILFDLTVAVEVGVVLAALLFINRIAAATQITQVDSNNETEGQHHSLSGKIIPSDVLIYRIFGSFSFGVADRLETALKRAQQHPKVLILRMRKVLYMDLTGLNALEDLFEKLNGQGQVLLLVAPQSQPFEVMQSSGFADKVGAENICRDIDHALSRANEILSQ